MYFKKLELFGFKSFADKTELVFEPGITAIVGPNGCGKTNISDAIRWVLGEQSAKQLRGGKMEDVIFNGSRIRQPLGMTYVSLTLDNSQNIIPVDYNEVNITRRLFRSGESEYLLNKLPSRHKDISELLMDTGIGVDAYSLLEQKQIELILSSKPEDRRFLFEEAAGVMKYKTRKQEALHKLEQTAQNLLRLNDIITELKSRILSLDYQARKARQYQKYQEELRKNEINSLFFNWSGLTQEEEEIQSSHNQIIQKLEEISTQINNYEVQISQLKLTLTGKDEEILKTQQNIFNLESRLAVIEEKLVNFNQRQKELQNEQEKITKEKEILQQRYKRLQQEEEQADKEYQDLQQELSRQEQALHDKEQKFNNQQEFLLSQNRNLEEVKTKLVDLLNKLAQFRNQMSTLNNEQKNILLQKEKIKTQRNNWHQDKINLDQQLKDLEQQVNTCHQQQNQLSQEISSFHKTKKEKEEFLTTLQIQLTQKKEDFNLKSSRLRSLEELKTTFAGYETGAKEILENKYPGVIGSVADILEVEERYLQALESVLQEKLQYLICQNTTIAENLIRELKNKEKGRATFLVLDRINSSQRFKYSAIDTLPGVLGKAINYVKSQPNLLNVIQHLLAGVWLVKDLETAKQLVEKIESNEKLVTLEGDVLTPTGLVSGGSSKSLAGLLTREFQIKHGQEELVELEVILTQAGQELGKNQEEYNKLDSQLQTLNQQEQTLLITINNIQKDYQQALQKQKEILTQIDVLGMEEQSLSSQEQNTQSLLNDSQAQLNQAQQAQLEAENNINQLAKEIEASQIESKKLTQEITDLKVNLASNSKKKEHLEIIHKRRQEECAHLEEENQKADSELKSLTNLLQELNQTKIGGEENINKLLEEKNNFDNILQGLRSVKQGLLDTLKELEQNKNKLKDELQIIQNQLHQNEIKIAQVTLRKEAIQKSLQENYNLKVEDINIPTNIEAISEEEITKLKKKIESLGAVNLIAIDEYEQLHERYTFLNKQQEDLIKAQDDLHKLINKINVTTREYFHKSFTQVQANFSTIFKQLFEGGEAELTLTNPEDLLETGIEINVQPPGKKLQNIHLLSGGEKALTAIAILFSIFMVKPSPFCVLDEIDAPLDDANLSRFVRMLKDFTHKSQFIVITHNKKTMEMADVLYGITMEEFGISKVVSVKFRAGVHSS